MGFWKTWIVLGISPKSFVLGFIRSPHRTANRENTLEAGEPRFSTCAECRPPSRPCSLPAIARFLNIISNTPALAFQSLGFFRGRSRAAEEFTTIASFASARVKDVRCLRGSHWRTSTGLRRAESIWNTHALPDYLFGTPVGRARDILDQFSSEALHAISRNTDLLGDCAISPKKGNAVILLVARQADARWIGHREQEPETQEHLLVTHSIRK